VLQRQAPTSSPVRQQALNPVHPGRHEPPLELGQHRAADAPVPPRGARLIRIDPRAAAVIVATAVPQLLADDRHHRRLVRRGPQ
jgi:hypothetical protein